MIRPGTMVWLLLVIAVGYAMFQVKYEVMQQEEMLARLNKDIAESREQIRVLDAEWSYLARPDRLKRLATRYLNLSPIAAAQIFELNAVPERPGAPPALDSGRKPASPAQTITTQAMVAQTTAPRGRGGPGASADQSAQP